MQIMTKIDWQDDATHPGRRAYRITGDSCREVQLIINARMRWVDTAIGGVEGSARFIGPAPIGNGEWGALGEVIIHD